MTTVQTVITTSNGRRYIVDLAGSCLREEDRPEKSVQFPSPEAVLGYVKRFAVKEDKVRWKQTEAGLQGELLAVQRTAAHLGAIKSNVSPEQQVAGTMFAPESPAADTPVQLSLL